MNPTISRHVQWLLECSECKANPSDTKWYSECGSFSYLGHYNSENRAHQLPASVPLPSISRPTLLASSHKGWPTKPPGEFPPLSLAPFAVFLESDRLALGNGFSLIHGGENNVFFLQQEGALRIMTQPKNPGILGPEVSLADKLNRVRYNNRTDLGFRTGTSHYDGSSVVFSPSRRPIGSAVAS